MRYPSSKRGNTPKDYRHNAGRAPQQWSETLIDPFFESKVPNAAGVEDKTGDALLRIARKAHGANVPGKNVAYGWPKSLCFFLQSRQTQISVLQHHAVNRVDFLADVSACILAEFRIARRKRRRGFKYVRLFAPEALLQSPRLFRAGGQESYLNLIAPGNVGNVEAGFSGRLQRMKLGVANVDLQLAILHQDFMEVIIFPVPINSRERGHLLGAKWRRATAHCSLFRSAWFGTLQILGKKYVCDLSDQRRRICVRRVAEHRCGEMLLRESWHVRAIPGVAAGVVYRWQAFVLAHHQPKSIVELLAVIELAAFEHLLEERRSAKPRVIEILIPQVEVLHGGVQARCAYCVEVRNAQLEGLVFVFPSVSQSIVLNDLCVVVSEMGVHHAQRLENILGRKLAQRHSAYSFHDQAHDRVTRVAINVLLARFEVQIPLPRHHGHHVVIRNQIQRIAPSR